MTSPTPPPPEQIVYPLSDICDIVGRGFNMGNFILYCNGNPFIKSLTELCVSLFRFNSPTYL